MRKDEIGAGRDALDTTCLRRLARPGHDGVRFAKLKSGLARLRNSRAG
jgi:hypothetical protein